MVVWQKPNLLVLDEPTNHLDLEMRHAMELALQGYEGALVLVSHDRHLLRNTVDELLLVHAGKVQAYAEDLAGYERWILSGCRAQDRPAAAPAASSRREQRQQAAARRERLRPLRKAVQRIEGQMQEAETELAELQDQLADNTLYDDERAAELARLLQREGELKIRASELEEQWLAQQQELEELEAAGG